MTLLDPFLGLDQLELTRELRAIVTDPHLSRKVTFHQAGGPSNQFASGQSPAPKSSRTVRCVGGPTQDKMTGAWSTGTRTYLILAEDFKVPKPAILPDRGDWIEETDGSRWRVSDADRGEFGALLYYVLKTVSLSRVP